MKAALRISIWILPVALAGCAMNALRVEVAGTVAAQAKTATAAARAYLGTVQETRDSFNSDLIGIDGLCAPDSAYIRLKPDYAAFVQGGDPAGWLCARDASAETYQAPIDLAPIDRGLDPDFALINAIGAYGDAITAIVDDKSGDPSADIAGAIALARAGEGLIDALSGAKPVIPGEDDPRSKAANGLITLLGQLANEQHQVNRLRALAASSGSTELIATLRRHLASWEIGRRTDNNMRLVVAKILFAQTLTGHPGPSARQAALATYYARSKQTSAATSLGDAIGAALDDLSAADEHLRNVLRDNPKLSDKDRAELARITRQRLTTAFNALTALILAIKGA
ncbi:hypothetical protein [Sphingomonas sp. KR3-1]|uniref:hypothetical protein n=1 Tax=Sphingomonas sp. KR3-1 TaxID=3156611 RepID=UPI0032B4D63A